MAVVIPACFEVTLKVLKGVYSDGDPPLPIPNREVKPVSADGTAPGGRVGRCRIFKSLNLVLAIYGEVAQLVRAHDS